MKNPVNPVTYRINSVRNRINSVALVAVINVCRQNGIKLTLMHFDRAAGNYYQQPVR